MSRKPGSLRKKPTKPTFVVSKNISAGKIKQEQSNLVENVPDEVNNYKKVVYCDFSDCAFNKQIPDLSHTETTIRNQYIESKGWKPLFREKVWNSICTRDEVVIHLERSFGNSGASIKVPACFTPRNTVSGHVDFSKRMGESFIIDDSQDPTAKDEGWVMENSPFQN
jgi:hypothetical protein